MEKNQVILSVKELADHLQDPEWVVVDCRFDLAHPDWGFQSYQEGHIPGAVYAHLDRDLSGPITPESGRHPLPDIHEITKRLSNWGIDQNVQVVVYDTHSGAYAARLWWLLRFLGHSAAAVLDGGWQAWQAEGYPTATGIEQRPAAVFEAKPDWEMVATTEDVLGVHLDPTYRLVDARSEERYLGEREPIDAVAGHIPGAVNRYHGDNLKLDGTFLPPETLRHQFDSLLGGVPPEKTILYCGSGVTSAHHLIAMESAGLTGSKLYVGSWSEWIRDRKRPTFP